MFLLQTQTRMIIFRDNLIWQTSKQLSIVVNISTIKCMHEPIHVQVPFLPHVSLFSHPLTRPRRSTVKPSGQSPSTERRPPPSPPTPLSAPRATPWASLTRVTSCPAHTATPTATTTGRVLSEASATRSAELSTLSLKHLVFEALFGRSTLCLKHLVFEAPCVKHLVFEAPCV